MGYPYEREEYRKKDGGEQNYEPDPGFRFDVAAPGSYQDFWNQWQNYYNRTGGGEGTQRYLPYPSKEFGNPAPGSSFNPTSWYQNQSQFDVLWDVIGSLNGGQPNPSDFAWMAGKTYEDNPNRKEISDYLGSGELRRTIENRGREEADTAYRESRRKMGEQAARQGLAGGASGFGATAETMAQFNRAKMYGDVARAAELSELEAKSGWAMQEARDISDLWMQMANTMLAEKGLAGGTTGGPTWGEAGMQFGSDLLSLLPDLIGGE